MPFAYSGTSQAERTTAGATTSRSGPLGIDSEVTAGATTTYIRDPGGALVAERVPGEDLYYDFDGLGSVIGLVDPAGTPRATYSYDPYGAHATATGINGALPANPWRYVGGYLDTATGLYHFGARYYDLGLGRFLQTDPIQGGSANNYDYVNGDPINAFDLSGLCNEATVHCVTVILSGTEELPTGFAGWESGRRGGFVYYVDTRRGNRAVLSTGDCSVPGPKSFQTACKTHDLGYDLMRFFGSSGSHGSIRKAVDNNLFNDFKGICGGVSWWRRPGCGIAARVGYEIVSGNSYRQGYGVP